MKEGKVKNSYTTIWSLLFYRSFSDQSTSTSRCAALCHPFQNIRVPIPELAIFFLLLILRRRKIAPDLGKGWWDKFSICVPPPPTLTSSALTTSHGVVFTHFFFGGGWVGSGGGTPNPCTAAVGVWGLVVGVMTVKTVRYSDC